MAELTGIDHFVLTVRDIARSIAFYHDVLGMQAQVFEAADDTRRWSLHFASQKINLHQAGKEFEPKAASPGPGTADFCLLTKSPIQDWIARIARSGALVETGPVPRSGALGPMMSIYLRDPDRNLIEIARYDD